MLQFARNIIRQSLIAHTKKGPKSSREIRKLGVCFLCCMRLKCAHYFFRIIVDLKAMRKHLAGTHPSHSRIFLKMFDTIFIVYRFHSFLIVQAGSCVYKDTRRISVSWYERADQLQVAITLTRCLARFLWIWTS